MEVLRVICETCRSRLKVRTDAIGEIHACPKCGSMVHIAPPADWSPAVALVGAAAQPALTITTSTSTIAPADFAVELPPPPATSPPASPAPATATPNAAAMPEFVAPQAATSPAAASGLSPLFWSAIGAATALTVAGVAYVLWPSGDKPALTPTPIAAVASPADNAPATVSPTAPEVKPSIVKQSAATETASVEGDAPEATPTDSTAVVPTVAETNVAATPPAAPMPPPAESNAVASAAAASVPPPAPEVPAAVADSQPAAPPAEASGPAQTSPAPAAANHVLKIDPLDFDPENLNVSPSTGAIATNSPPTPAPSSIPPDPPAEAPAAKAAEDDRPPVVDDMFAPPPEKQLAVNVRRGPVTNDSSARLDTAARFAASVPSLQVADMPLTRFIETISELSSVPITLNPIQLELNGISPRAAVSVDASDETLDKILRDALSSQRFELTELDGRAAVAIPNSDEHREVDFDLKDMVKDGDAAQIAKLIERFVAPSTWQSAGGKGTITVDGTTLHINQSLLARREALIFCERLRLARGLQQKSKYPAAMLSVDSPYGKLAPKLGQSTTFTFLPWTRLADVLHQWQELTGLTILVDWSALDEADFAPTSPLACSTIDRPWTEALDGVLEPLGLAWWALDDQTIQITTLDTAQRIERVEFYSIPKQLRDQFKTTEELTAALQKQIADRPTKQGETAEPRIDVDDVSGRLIIRATPDVQRFLSGYLKAK